MAFRQAQAVWAVSSAGEAHAQGVHHALDLIVVLAGGRLVQEQHAPSGRHYLDLVVVTNQAECVGWGKAGTRFGEDSNLRGLEESFLRGRRPCPAAAFAYSLSAVLDSGLLIIPAVHEVQVPYDTQVNLASSLVYVEDVPSGTEAKVEVSVTSCAGALELLDSS